MDIQPKTVLITGCSVGGIGEGLALIFLERGYHVFATVRNPAKISDALSSAENVTVLTLDVLSSDSIAAAVTSVKKETGGTLDVLINNSGAVFVIPALDVSIEQAKKLYDLNVWAPLAMLQAFAPLLIQAKGCVVNNASANAVAPFGLMSVYNGSKAALAVASETWRLELKPLGVRTITLITTGTKTNAFSSYQGFKLPESSYYFGIQDFLDKITDGRMQDGAITPRQYALQVVRAVENGTTGTVWAGTQAFIAHIVLWLSPQSILDRMIESIVPLSSEMAKASQKRIS